MNSCKVMKLLVATLASATMTIASHAAAPMSPAGGMPRDAAGAIAPADRLATIQRLGLDNPELRLTARQGAEIDNIVNLYVVNQEKLAAAQPAAPGSRASEDAIALRRVAYEKMRIDIGNVLDGEQKRTWEATRLARQARADSAISRSRQQPARSR